MLRAAPPLSTAALFRGYSEGIIIHNMKRVAVIGAGAAGLCCARHLSKFPETFQFTVYEQSEQVGGTWVYSNHSQGLPDDVRTESSHGPHSSTYKNLRTNLPKEMMLFPDFPIYDNHLPSFPTHREILTYFKKYCEHFQLDRFIEFGKLVEQVTPITLPSPPAKNSLDSVKWRIVTKSQTTGERNSEEFDFIFVCSGHFFAPFVPEIKGLSSFPRLVAHSHWYREPEPFTGQAVLVVGTGPSGEDLIVDLAPHARVVHLSSRKGPLKSKVPQNVEQLPGISELKEDGRVCFENGEERSVDSVVLATGYLYFYPFLSEESGIKVVEGKRVTHLYKHTFNVAHPSMAMIGIYFAVVPLPGFDLQVQWIVRVWRGEKALPPKQEMLEDVEKTYQQRLDEGLPPHLAGHYLDERQWKVFREFAEFGGVKPLNCVIEQLYNVATHGRENQLLEYRSREYKVVNEDTYHLVERRHS